MVAKAGNFNETSTTFVAEVRAAAIAGHVVAARRTLDEHTTGRTLLAICHSVRPLSCPLLEHFVASHECFARHVAVPRRVALEAPLDPAVFAHDLHFFLAKLPPKSSGTRKMVLGDVRTVRARFSLSVALRVHSESLEAILLFGCEVTENFWSTNGVAAFRVGARELDESVAQARTDRRRQTSLAHDLSAASQLQEGVAVVVADDAGTCAGLEQAVLLVSAGNVDASNRPEQAGRIAVIVDDVAAKSVEGEIGIGGPRSLGSYLQLRRLQRWNDPWYKELDGRRRWRFGNPPRNRSVVVDIQKNRQAVRRATSAGRRLRNGEAFPELAVGHVASGKFVKVGIFAKRSAA